MFGDRGALVQPNFQDELAIGLAPVECGNVRPHRKRRRDRIGGSEEGRHDGITNRLDDRAVVTDRDLLQTIEMLLDQRESIEIADAVVERCRIP